MQISAGRLVLPFALVLLTLSGCGSDDGKDGLPGDTTIVGVLPASSAEQLAANIEDVEVNSAPVITFTATDGNGVPIAGLTSSNLRFNIAKLKPGAMGDPSSWQNYINRLAGGELQGTTESDGTLEDLGNGQYRYTFATDITDPANTVGNISYEPSLTHRVAMQISGFPASNPTIDFRPDGGKISLQREIVETASCNSCHNKLALHGGGRVETKYCVTCHNPGSTDPDTGNTVDFKVLIHKIHMGEELPSVAFGPNLIDDGGSGDDGTGTYQIVGYLGRVHDYSTVVFPQDIRNCTKCHSESAETPQGDNWKTAISMEACGSCHDNIDFSKDGSDTGANDPLGHSGGVVSDNSECKTCHASGRIAGSVEERHRNPVAAAEPTFKFNILKICGTAIDMDPDCSGTPVTPTVTFSVSDPTGGTHGYANSNYNLNTESEFGSGASLNVITGWGTVTMEADSLDYNNDNAPSASRPARAESVNLSYLKANAIDNGSGEFTVTLAAMPITSGSASVALEGHPRAESVPGSGSFDTSIPVKGAVAYFGVNGSPLVERRVAVDVSTKCDKCHATLSLHGNNRADNAQLCVLCHNPRNTDIGRRSGTGIDGKAEETVDLKVLIHAIHAGAEEEHGFREKGIVIYGYGGRSHDFSHVRFPGILNDCTTCHNDGTYELAGKWEAPLQNGIQATTIDSGIDVADQTDDLYTTPTAAVCSACHDGATARAHMENNGGAKFAVDQAGIAASYETCSICHGPGKIADLEVMHGID